MKDFIEKMGREHNRDHQHALDAPGQIWHAAAKTPKPAEPDLDRVWRRIESDLAVERHDHLWMTPIKMRLALSAVILVCVALVTWVFWLPHARLISTGPGQTQKCTLPDGSEVVMNAVSQIRFDRGFGKKNRHVELQGEAFFDVVPRDLPFSISVAHLRVQVIGTRFNLRSRENGVEIGVVEGVVEVRTLKESEISRVVLAKGEKLFCPPGALARPVQGLTYGSYPPWTSGVLAFDGETFSSVCRELERRFDIRFVIENPNVGAKLVSGNLDGNGNLHNVLEVLGRLGGCSITQEKGVYVIR